MSAAKATGWAWKLPPLMAVSSSGKTIGLSVTAPASMVRVRAALAQQVERGAHHLRLAAEAVGVLDLAAAAVAGEDRAAFEQSGDLGGDADLAGLAAQRRDARVERLGRCPSSASTDNAPAARAAANTRSPMNKASSAIAVEAWVPLISARPSLGPSSSGSRPSFCSAAAAGRIVAGDVDAAVAHQRRDQMRERGEVARRADAALARDHRHRVAVEQALERVDDQRPDARIAAAEAEQFQDDHQPDDVARQRLAEAGAVRQDQIALQLGQPVVGNAGVGEAGRSRC